MNDATLKALRSIGTKKAYYRFMLHFTRLFTAGNLKGLTHDDSIGFCRAVDGDEWVSEVNAANAKGKVDYKVVSWRVVEVTS